MISSVVLRFETGTDVDATLAAINQRAELEVGEFVDGRSLPVVIEADDRESLESATRWLDSLLGVEQVDVVFVHFESSKSSLDL